MLCCKHGPNSFKYSGWTNIGQRCLKYRLLLYLRYPTFKISLDLYLPNTDVLPVMVLKQMTVCKKTYVSSYLEGYDGSSTLLCGDDCEIWWETT